MYSAVNKSTGFACQEMSRYCGDKYNVEGRVARGAEAEDSAHEEVPMLRGNVRARSYRESIRA